MLTAADSFAAEPLSDATVVPPLYIELLNNDSGPVASTHVTPTTAFELPLNFEHKFRHKKGHDVIDRILNTNIQVRLCSSQTNTAIAAAVVDLLPFGLGATEISNESLPLVQESTDDVLKVRCSLLFIAQQTRAGTTELVDSHVLVSLALMCI